MYDQILIVWLNHVLSKLNVYLPQENINDKLTLKVNCYFNIQTYLNKSSVKISKSQGIRISTALEREIYNS